jgi:hypothetical protein
MQIGAASLLATWPPAKDYVYESDAKMSDHLRRADQDGIEITVRSIPHAAFVTTAELPSELPPDWPAAVVCATSEDLFEQLARHA